MIMAEALWLRSMAGPRSAFRLMSHGIRMPISSGKSNRRTNATSAAPQQEPPRSNTHALVAASSSPDHTTETPLQRLEALKIDTKPFSEFLTDTYSRQHNYLRISITERCNLRCLYCMPAEGIQLSPKPHLLTPPEILYLSSLFVNQGVTKIRLTGGEPTVHPAILSILREIGSLRSKGLTELGITTNGLTLARKLDSMIESGVTGINLSLDTLDPFQFQIMTRRPGHEKVMQSISRILEARKMGANVRLKVNCVVIRGMNDHQILPFVDMTKDKDLEIRFIEYMPFDGNRWETAKMMGYQEMLAVIRGKYEGLEKVQDHPNDTSKTFRVPGHAGRIGFITSMTEHFCGSCNRLRITSDGNLKVCLFGNSEVNLRDMLRQNFNKGEPIDAQAWEAMKQVEMDRHEGRVQDEVLGLQDKERQLLEVIGMAVKRKKEKHAGIGVLEHMKNRPMILIGHNSPFRQSFSQVKRPTSTQTAHIPTHLLSPHPQSPQSLRYYTTTPSRPPPSSQNPTSNPPTPSSPSQLPDDDTTTKNKSLTHLNPSSEVHMVHLPSSKPTTTRTAIATSTVRFSNHTPLHQITTHSSKKGDVLSVARVAGIMAAKKTPEIVPLCHNILISGVSVEVSPKGPVGTVDSGDGKGVRDREDNGGSTGKGIGVGNESDGKASTETGIGQFGGVEIRAEVKTSGQTGVEMEALTAATAASLTIYDMCKGLDRGMVIEKTEVVEKMGGRSGNWVGGVRVDERGDSREQT